MDTEVDETQVPNIRETETNKTKTGLQCKTGNKVKDNLKRQTREDINPLNKHFLISGLRSCSHLRIVPTIDTHGSDLYRKKKQKTIAAIAADQSLIVLVLCETLP